MLFAACGSSGSTPISRVFEAAPWTGDETMTYTLLDEGSKPYGTCDLQTRPGFEPGKTALSFLCHDDRGNRDDQSAVVDAASLRPFSATHTIVAPADNKRTEFSSTYQAQKVAFVADQNGKRITTERDLPQPTTGAPDAGYYDEWSLLWLVRGIPLRAGFKGAYADVNAGTGRLFTVDISVQSREQVKVPAGTFDTWKVRVHTSSVTHYFWVEAGPPHRLIRARVEYATYELLPSN